MHIMYYVWFLCNVKHTFEEELPKKFHIFNGNLFLFLLLPKNYENIFKKLKINFYITK